MTKFGTDQLSSPPPLWWRRLERSLIIVIAPALTAYLTDIIQNEEKERLALSSVIFITAMIKATGMFLGTDEPYPNEEQ
jgi:hypothetical protein